VAAADEEGGVGNKQWEYFDMEAEEAPHNLYMGLNDEEDYGNASDGGDD
jgi:hypothetical protein